MAEQAPPLTDRGKMDKVHACLDGELSAEELSPAELERLAGLEAAIAEAGAELRSVPVPDLVASVMAGLPPVHQVAPTDRLLVKESLWAWIWKPRPVAFTYRPAYAMGGLAAAALVALILPFHAVLPGAGAPAVAEGEATAPRLYVQFRLEAPEASQVSVAGSFTGWEPAFSLRETTPGVWTALIPLEPGVHDYTFVIDGRRWVIDPYAPTVPDSFGGSNSRLFLPAPAESA